MNSQGVPNHSIDLERGSLFHVPFHEERSGGKDLLQTSVFLKEFYRNGSVKYVLKTEEQKHYSNGELCRN